VIAKQKTEKNRGLIFSPNTFFLFQTLEKFDQKAAQKKKEPVLRKKKRKKFD
jgi:hypothetical protein